MNKPTQEFFYQHVGSTAWCMSHYYQKYHHTVRQESWASKCWNQSFCLTAEWLNHHLPQATSSLPTALELHCSRQSSVGGGRTGKETCCPKDYILVCLEGIMCLRIILTKPKIFMSYSAKSNKTKTWLLFYILVIKCHLISSLSSSNTFITNHKLSRSFTKV